MVKMTILSSDLPKPILTPETRLGRLKMVERTIILMSFGGQFRNSYVQTKIAVLNTDRISPK
uniref:Uncharacterized protein n=1 Tax=Manihot esculenta TaxID=3983 RepID=A0A2C9U3T0_MANES